MDGSSEGTIVTFYSYKGGTGRTMALANVAWILAQGGKRVLAIDWDLESPGLHKFFQPFLQPDIIAAASGITDLISDYSWAVTSQEITRRADWHLEYARIVPHAVSLDWKFDGAGELYFVSAGRQNREYSTLISSMDWDNFYERLGGGQFFEALRADMKQNYDYVLIDSRTGLSDIADICTVQMPDVLVDCFTLSAQSIEGAAAVAKHIDELYPGRGIRIMPVPMRVENAENDKVEAGRAHARAQFSGFPRGISGEEATKYWLDVEVPYRPFYAFEETLATFGDVPKSHGTLLAAYERLTAQITGQEQVPYEIDDERRLATLRRFARLRTAEAAPEVVQVVLSYVSADRPWIDWISAVLEQSGCHVVLHCADSDSEELIADITRRRGFTDADGAAPVVLALLSPAYVASAQAERVWERLTDTAHLISQQQRLIAVRIAHAKLPRSFENAVPVDLSGLSEERAIDSLLLVLDRVLPSADGLTSAARAPVGLRFPAATRKPHVWNVGARNARFTGRAMVLERLRTQLLNGGQPPVPVVLCGLGGVGKTQIALEYAYRFRTDYDIVWWVPAESTDQIITSLEDLARHLGFEAQADSSAAANAACDALRRGTPHARWLLIFDNATGQEQLQRYLPGGDGHVIITSRNSTWAEIAVPLDVTVFAVQESQAHLMRRVPGLSADGAARIGAQLGHLPLAVEQAAAWLRATGQTADAYLELLDKQLANVLDYDSPADYSETVARTWDLSFEQLNRSSHAAGRMLQLCAFFAPAPISLDLIYGDQMAHLLADYDRPPRDKVGLGRLVGELSRFALARIDQANSTLEVHRLVQAVIRSRMALIEQEQARRDVHRILTAARPDGGTEDRGNWPRFDRILPHVQASHAVESDDEATWHLLTELVRYQWRRNRFEQALTLGTELQGKWVTKLGPDHPQYLYLQSQLANVLRSQGHYKKAQEKDDWVLRRQRQILGENHLQTLITAGGLAADLRALGKFKEALALDQETYERLVLLDARHPRTLSAANNLAVSCRLVGDFRRARELDTNTLAARAALLGPDQPDTLLSTAYLAQDLREAGDFRQSAELLKETLDKYERLIGGKTLEALRIAKSLAVSLRRAGHREEARRIALATCSVYELEFPETPDALAASLEQASCLSAVGAKDRARVLAESVFEKQRDTLGESHPYTLAVATNLSSYLRGTGHLWRAGELGESTLRRLRETLGDRHPFFLSCAVNVANALADLRRVDEAASLEEETLEALRSILGPEHPDTLACKANLSISREDQGQFAEAAELRSQAVTALRKILGDSHPSVADVQRGKRLNRDLESQPV